MNLKTRLRALERALVAPGEGRCQTCAHEPGAPVQLRLVFAEGPDAGGADCPECGRPLIVRLEFDDPRQDAESPW